MESRVFSQKSEVIAEMDQMVVLSLYTDNGPRAEEFGEMRNRLTGSSTNPMYIVVSPWDPEKVLYQAEFNQAMGDSFARKLGQVNRRVARIATKQAPEVQN